MKRMVAVLTVFALSGCAKEDKPEPVLSVFKKDPVIHPVSAAFPGEVSGMADSYSKPGFVWLLQDRDNPAELLTISHTGQQGPTVIVKGAENQDWEDVVIGAGPEEGKKYLYIADAGDNFAAFDKYYIYRFEEPASGQSETGSADKISFIYDDGQHHNTEAILVDPASRDIILITKDIPSLVFVLSYPYNTTTVNTALKKTALQQSTITSAALSPDGKELLLRTYSSMYYWKKNPAESIIATLQKPAIEIPVISEPQGESVSFKTDNSGFFTFSENAGLPLQLSLYFYPRN